MKKIVLIIILQLQFLTFLVAQTYTWTGVNSDNVTDAGNWTPAWTPNFAPLICNLIIPSGTPNDPNFVACNIGGSGSITVQTGATAVFNTSLIVGYSGTGILTNYGDITLLYCPLTVGYNDGSSGTIDNYGTIGTVGSSSSVYIGGTGDFSSGLIKNYGQCSFKTLTIGGTGSDATGILTNSNNGLFLSTNTTINANGSLIINSSAKGTISGTLTNNGILNLNSTSSGIFSLMFGTYLGLGTVNTQLYLTGGGSPNYNWHYIAVPFTSPFGKAIFISESTNLLAYYDSRVTSNESEGWLWHDGVAANGVAAGTPFYSLVYGKGYNYYTPNSSTTIILTRTNSPIGSSLGTVNTVYSGGTPGLTQFGYNLIGNSLTCSIDWDNVTFSGSVGSTVYYTTGNKWASYLTGSGGTNGGYRYIPPLQGFFVKANATGASVNFTGAGVKVHSTQARYKKGSDSQEETKGDIIYPKVKLELTGNLTSDETIVWFNENATAGYDEKYDGFKLFPSDATVGQLYSILNGQQFVINGIPLPSSTFTVPLGIMIPQLGVYSLDKKVLEVLDNYNVSLIDKMNGNYTVDIKSVNSYSFSSDAGTFTDRFVLKFDNILTSVENLPIVNKKFNVYGTKDFINIMPFDDFTNETIVRIYNLTGRIVKQANISGFYKGSLLQLPFAGSQGIYIVEIRSGSIQISRDKVFVN